MEALQDVQDKYNQLVLDNEQLEIQLKDLENCDNQAYIKNLREKNAQQTIELASLKVEKVRAEGEQQKIMRRITMELGMISHKKSLITIFGHKHKIRKFIKILIFFT